MFKKFKIPIKIKLVKKNKGKKLRNKLIFSKHVKNFILILLIAVLIILSIDLGSYIFFNKEVLAYAPKNGILVTKKQVTQRLFQLSYYTNTNLQQLTNDVAIQQLVLTLAKKNKKFITKKQVIKKLQKEGTKKPSKELVRSAQVVLNIEQLLTKKPEPVTEKEIENFYKANKEIAFKKKNFKDVKEDIKKYLEAQKKQALILQWVQEQLKNSNFQYTKDIKDKKYHIGKGIYILKTILIPYLLTK